MNHYDRQIFQLALPAIVSNVTVPLLGLVDVAIVGHIGNAVYISAIAIGSMIFNVIYWVFGFLRMGTSGLTAQARGRRDLREAVGVLCRSLSVGLLVALLILLLQHPLRLLAYFLIQPPAEALPLVDTYYRIAVWGAPAMLSLYGLSGWYIGMQNTRIPMFVSVAQNVVNIIASLSFVFGLGMKMDGVALGTLVAQWAGAVIAFTFWLRHYTRLNHYDWRRGLFAHGSMARFFNVNRDIFLRTLFLVAVNFFFTAAGARQGNLILSVNTLLLTIYTVSSYVMDGFAFAGEALSGRYYGAGNGAAFHAVVRRLFFWGFIVSVAIMLLFAGGGKRFQPGFVKGSPNPGFFYFLLQLLEAAGYLSVGHERSVGKPEQVIRTLTRVGDRFRPFGDVHLLQPFDQAVDAFDFPGDSHSYFVHGLFAPRNIYQTDLLKLLQEGGLFSIQQNEGIAGHFIDHSSSSSSSAA